MALHLKYIIEYDSYTHLLWMKGRPNKDQAMP